MNDVNKKETNESWEIAGKTLSSRLLIGSALYPSPSCMEDAITISKSQIVTVSLRRATAGENNDNKQSWNIIKDLGLNILPNTAGSHSAKEAITTARIAREAFGTNWIKLEVIGDQYNLQPDPFETVKAAEVLKRKGANSVMACCTHGVLSGPAYERIEKGELDELVISDTIPTQLNAKKITILTASTMIGEAIRRIHNNESVNSIFIG